MSATTLSENPFVPRPAISHVIFDFDGTLSWLRHGWPETMFEVFRPHFPSRKDESADAIHDLLLEEILSLNGKPSIYQMQRFAELAVERGGSCPTPEALLHTYQSRLDEVIRERSAQITDGKSVPDEFVVFGARAMLERLQERGVTLIILSGTIEHRVKEEAALLDLERYFGRHIYGSTLDHTQFSKRMVIDRILREEKIQGEHLLSIGDGPVEIAQTKAVGGRAVGLASDENVNGSGKMDAFKVRQLQEAGADLLIADFRGPDVLMQKIFGSANTTKDG